MYASFAIRLQSGCNQRPSGDLIIRITSFSRSAGTTNEIFTLDAPCESIFTCGKHARDRAEIAPRSRRDRATTSRLHVERGEDLEDGAHYVTRTLDRGDEGDH